MGRTFVCYEKSERDLYEEGYSIQEIADRMGMSYTAIRYRLLKQGTQLRAKNGKVKPNAKT